MIFVGLLSVVFLKKRLEWFRWTGMAVIVCGIAMVSIDLSKSTKITTNIATSMLPRWAGRISSRLGMRRREELSTKL